MSIRLLGWLVALMAVASCGDASAYTLNTLYDFCAQQDCPDGADPNGPLLMDQSGNLFGITVGGGTGNGPNGPAGTVFELHPRSRGGWSEHVLHSFCLESNCTDGWYPSGHLIQDVAGNLYGTARGGNDGCDQLELCQGIVFALIPNRKRTQWKFKIVYRFCHKTPDCRDGALPLSWLNYAGAASGAPYDGVSPLYVVTRTGGAHNSGVALEVTPGNPKWHGSVIHSFPVVPDAWPDANLFVDVSGDVYGADNARIFELTPDVGKKHWSKVTLRRFCVPYFDDNCLRGSGPHAPSVRGTGGSFFGTTFRGGKWTWPPDSTCSDFNPTGGCGVLYKLVPDGERTREKVLYDFCSEANCTDGAFPDPNLSMDSSGNLFGTALDGGSNESRCSPYSVCPGVVFRFGKDGYHVLYNFCSETSCTDGNYPVGGVILDAAGNLFGVAESGGQHNQGRIYELVP